MIKSECLVNGKGHDESDLQLYNEIENDIDILTNLGFDKNDNLDKIIKEKISADHLLYVSLKYTKTSEVIANLVSLIQEQQAIIESLKARLDAANL